MAKLLVEADANVDLQDGDGSTALIMGVYRRQFEMVKRLVEAGKLDLQDSVGRTALMSSVMAGLNRPINIVRLLVEAGAQLDLRDVRGQTALMGAVAMHRLDMVQLLVEAGARLDCRDNMDRTVLSMAQTSYNEHIRSWLHSGHGVVMQRLPVLLRLLIGWWHHGFLSKLRESTSTEIQSAIRLAPRLAPQGCDTTLMEQALVYNKAHEELQIYHPVRVERMQLLRKLLCGCLPPEVVEIVLPSFPIRSE